MVSAALVIFLWVAVYLTRDGHPVTVETLWYRVGWGALPIVAYFGIAHGLLVGVNGDFLLTVIVTGVAGSALLWLKERTSSIWIAVLIHNLANVGGQFANAVPIRH